MLSSLALLVLAATSALAQIPGLPSCAQNCIKLPAGCQTTDFKCICADKSFITNISCCVAGACNTSDQQTIIKFAAGLCGGYGVTVPTVAGCSAGAASTATSDAASAGSSAAGSSAAGSASSAGVTAFAMTAGNGSVVTTTATVSVTSTTTTTARASTANTAGAANFGPQAGAAMLGGVMAGMALL